ncbi:BRCA1-associated protein 2 [Teladorsagia circumcincta]|uniref:BRCA1-associated protein 2 n=1 Tax=Teladorsagia circumcincta TaxID=45464 RepID=A0A2G9U3G3_TELCI|nr:BRCA1-associated protein 2 [Teladorsagia circumcincta]
MGSVTSRDFSEEDAYPIQKYPLALKLMYNFALDLCPRLGDNYLWQSMGAELVPLPESGSILNGRMGRYRPLPAFHPNVVRVLTAFVDRMPILDDAKLVYPDALPSAPFYEMIINEPRTMFVVMKRVNPFYSRLDSATYREEDLPSLSPFITKPIRDVVHHLLRRNPKELAINAEKVLDDVLFLISAETIASRASSSGVLSRAEQQDISQPLTNFRGRRTYSEVVVESLEGDKCMDAASCTSDAEHPQSSRLSKADSDLQGPGMQTIERIKIIRDSTPNEYMVILKFKTHNDAVVFYDEFNGTQFNSLEPNRCRLLFVDKIECVRFNDLPVKDRMHFENTSHTFCLQVGGQRVWDYAGDNYVHRLIQSDTEGKVVEYQRGDREAESDEKKEKLDGIKLEYTCLLTSQLESQRMYFEARLADMERAMNNMEKMAQAQGQAAVMCHGDVRAESRAGNERNAASGSAALEVESLGIGEQMCHE